MSDIKDLREKKEFVKAIKLYEENYKVGTADKWDSWNYVVCLNAESKYHKAEEISMEIYRLYPQFKYNNNILSWLIFRNHIDDYEVLHEILDFADFILSITEQSKSSSYENTVWKVVELYKDGNSKKVIEWLNKLEVTRLSSEPKFYIDGKKKIEYQSNLEHWYSLMSKNLFKEEDYVTCSAICKEALNALDRFHHSNEVWIKARDIYSDCILTSDYSKIQDILKLTEKRNHFILYYYVFKLAVEFGNTEDAIMYSSIGCLLKSPENMKLKLFSELGFYLVENNYNDEGLKLLFICKIIRDENDWPIPNDLEEILSEEEMKDSKSQIFQGLKVFWSNKAKINDNRHIGIIKVLKKDKGFGFIQLDKEKIYFKLNEIEKSSKSKLIIGSKVEFSIKDSYDNIKSTKSICAVKIRLVEDF